MAVLAFVRPDGLAWDILVRPTWLGDVLQANGWPEDRDKAMTWEEVIPTAMHSTPVKPDRFRPKGSS